MRCVATIIMKDEGKALRAAARVKKEKPQGVDMKYEHMKRDTYRILLYAENGRELVVQQYVRDVGPNLDGFVEHRFSAA
jgi:hypothetical protein